MGWKSIKEHYGIERTVHVTRNGNIGIGTAYINDLIIVSPSGEIISNEVEGRDPYCQYVRAIKADRKTFSQLYQQADVFEESATCYAYNEETGEIVEKQFEPIADQDALGVTHDGSLMWSNRYSTDKDKVIRWAIEETQAMVRAVALDIERQETYLERAKADLQTYQNSLTKFESLAQVVNA